MEYIDLEDDFPKSNGVYEIRIKSLSGSDRFCDGDWRDGKGFYPSNGNLLEGEYITGWREKNF